MEKEEIEAEERKQKRQGNGKENVILETEGKQEMNSNTQKQKEITQLKGKKGR